jgi:hypothetical protein
MVTGWGRVMVTGWGRGYGDRLGKGLWLQVLSLLGTHPISCYAHAQYREVVLW